MKLIDADSLLHGKQDHEMISSHLVWNAPSIDAVKVIRCKDCINWQTNWKSSTLFDGHYCAMVDSVTRKYFYCAYAERKNENGN